jgi:hypothetical protein
MGKAMKGVFGSYRILGWLTAMMIVAVSPASLQAAWLGFRNDLKVPIIVKSTPFVNNVMGRDKLQVLFPGEVSWDPIPRPISKIVTILEGKRPNRALFQDTVTIKEDLFYSVQLDAAGKVKLVPTKMPTPPGKPMR